MQRDAPNITLAYGFAWLPATAIHQRFDNLRVSWHRLVQMKWRFGFHLSGNGPADFGEKLQTPLQFAKGKCGCSLMKCHRFSVVGVRESFQSGKSHGSPMVFI
jgi:hypothetical protein